MKVFHIANEARCSYIVSQGLLACGFEVACDRNYRSLGEVLIPASNRDLAKNADLIFCGHDGAASFFDKHHLWSKVVFYEFRDRCQINPRMLKAKCYFKRSVSCGPDRIPVDLQGAIPINHCAMDEYFLFSQKKTHNVGCFFDETNWRLGKRRSAILKATQLAGFSDSLIGHSTAFANPARLAVSDAADNNPFVEYLKAINRCKIIFTAQPEPVDGDHRTWEAMASKALVFRDRSWIPTPHYPVDGVHCIEYDATDVDSIAEAIEKSRYYLKNEQARSKIADAGYELVNTHHRSVDRVRFMLKYANRRVLML